MNSRKLANQEKNGYYHEAPIERKLYITTKQHRREHEVRKHKMNEFFVAFVRFVVRDILISHCSLLHAPCFLSQ